MINVPMVSSINTDDLAVTNFNPGVKLVFVMKIIFKALVIILYEILLNNCYSISSFSICQ
ncbi:hypothetical protein SAMN04488069_10998 [Hymenobacter psychrophilus]|uniref:Uncharacterized protein n=1 Tax=Hymenobacter psychrophilus TaxID=651662 RepID=A0A1H3KE28_9BACT|nr:hypothetical protein SAMN04488069_10998 [Hymenobacter psychrophilus]